jgi:predicted O-methyltransferase YrrM
MKQSILKLVERAANRARMQFALQKARGDSFDVLEMAFLRAAHEAAEYYQQNMIHARPFDRDLDLLTHALSMAKGDGLFLEFGVATGRTISHMAGLRRSIIYGFDSFEGLPELWRSGFDEGAFAGHPPSVPSNVTIVKGLFAETVPNFLVSHPDPVSFLHVDCDLYSSTKCVFDLLAPRLNPGTVIVFDEYWNYPGWQQHEYKAFLEFIGQTSRAYRYDSFVPSHQQVCVVLT